jgi:hypothetical protein
VVLGYISGIESHPPVCRESNAGRQGCGYIFALHHPNNIINIKQQVYHISLTAEDKQGGVRLGLNKSQSEEVHGEPAVPSLGRLLQPVEKLVEAGDLVRLRGINKPHWLAAVDCL